MNYYLISVLWIVVIVTVIEIFYSNWKQIQELKIKTYPNVIFLLLLIIIAVIAVTNSFHGLEYEDAYEYLYSGNLLSRNQEVYFNGLNPICILGSSRNCQLVSCFSHPAGYSILISWLIKFFGYWDFWSQFCSIFFLIFCSVFVYLLGREAGIQASAIKWGIITCIATPVIFLFGISGFSETASSFLIILFLLRIQRFLLNRNSYRFKAALLNSISLTSILALAILVRRDNLVLLLAGLIAIILMNKNRKQRFTNSCVTLLISISLGLGVVIANIATNLHILNLGIVQVPGVSAFSLTYVRLLTPNFLKYVINPKIFGITTPLVLISLFLSHVWKKIPEVALVLFLYIGLCLSFAHSYYFIYSGETPTIHFERYLLQIWPLISLLTASVFDLFLDKFNQYSGIIIKRLKYISVMILTAICIFFVFIGYQRRSQWSKEEISVRFSPYIQVLKSIPSESWLVIGEPILIDIVSNGEKQIIDYSSVGERITGVLINSILKNYEVYSFLPEYSIEKPEKRYREASAILSEYRRDTLKKFQVGDRTYILSKLSLL